MAPKNIDDQISTDDLIPLKEGGLNRIFNKYHEIGFIIFSNCLVEPDKDVSEALFKALKRTLVDKGYGFVPVWGSSVESRAQLDEKLVKQPFMIIANYKVASYTVHSEDNLTDLGILLCKTYNQSMFFYKPTIEADKAYSIDMSGNVIATFAEKTIDDLAKEYCECVFNVKRMDGNSFGQTDKLGTVIRQFYMHPSPGYFSGAMKRYGESFYSRSYLIKA